MSKVLDSCIDHGVVILFGEIDEEMAANFFGRIQYYLNHPKRPAELKIFVNSAGGSCPAATSIVHAMSLFPGKITTCVVGDCQSMATAISLAGDWRQMTSDSLFMFHAPFLETEEEAGKKRTTKEDAEKTAKTLQAEESRLTNLYGKVLSKKRDGAKRPRISKKKLSKMITSGETWLSARQMLSLGLIDEII